MEPWQERLAQEFREAKERVLKLREYMAVEPSSVDPLLLVQENIMSAYVTILAMRMTQSKNTN